MMIKKLWQYCHSIVIPVFVVYLLMNFVFINAYVPSGSMENTIMTGNRVFGVRFLHNYNRGDIIVFHDPDGSGYYLIKRVIGLPGDKVEIKTTEEGDVNVIVNGAVLQEPYLREDMLPENFEINVPENSYFVMGDNRNESYDARYWTKKTVHETEIIGKALAVYWPVSDVKSLK